MDNPQKRKPADADSGPPNRRKLATEQRRKSILAAALEVFDAEGFASARLDDIAVKAGVAKGTIYLFFEDKEHLFEQLLITAVAPVIERLEQLASGPSMPIDDVLAAMFAFFRNEVLGTDRRKVVRLVLEEGRHFPRISETYYRNVVSKGLALIRRIAENAHARGELPHDELERFPHLVIAPLLISVLWEGLFSRLEPLDVEGLLAAHHSLLVGDRNQTKQGED